MVWRIHLLLGVAVGFLFIFNFVLFLLFAAQVGRLNDAPIGVESSRRSSAMPPQAMTQENATSATAGDEHGSGTGGVSLEVI